jgi:hypothetical protein
MDAFGQGTSRFGQNAITGRGVLHDFEDLPRFRTAEARAGEHWHGSCRTMPVIRQTPNPNPSSPLPHMNSALAATVSAKQEAAIVIERDLNAPKARGRCNRLQLCLDEKEGECQGYVVTICLPASYLSKVSKVRLQAA